MMRHISKVVLMVFLFILVSCHKQWDFEIDKTDEMSLKNEDMEISEDYFWRLNKAFGDRYNIKWFQGDSPYMTVKEAIEAKDKLPVSQIMPDSSAEIIIAQNFGSVHSFYKIFIRNLQACP